MAKAIAPLFAVEASGKIGNAVVYDKRGFVRIYTKPSNPRTEEQQQVRCQFSALAAAVRQTKKHARGVLRGLAETPYRWSADAIGAALKNNGWEIHKAAYAALEDSDRNSWQTNAKDFWKVSVNPQAPCFAGQEDHAEGLLMYVYTRGLLAMGVPTSEVASDTPNNWLQFLNNNSA